eukprot:CAMPEP_0202821646 /NCGR_PEP_ID=MMETSP1389-20130828/10513_1 /ASSEMBLY_ACC=CAM_ASM_000865 /TAXON_ID=302021 /ORGANISM="Rhodomonas sp., Strain CCMP768" /LENGTH=164 /DNA_ID=CAMNT_0049494451 /DNA_START=270 /DNA_END=762 /DNA_ORIENTATION=+
MLHQDIAQMVDSVETVAVNQRPHHRQAIVGVQPKTRQEPRQGPPLLPDLDRSLEPDANAAPANGRQVPRHLLQRPRQRVPEIERLRHVHVFRPRAGHVALGVPDDVRELGRGRPGLLPVGQVGDCNAGCLVTDEEVVARVAVQHAVLERPYAPANGSGPLRVIN